MDRDQMKGRTLAFGVRIVRLVSSLPSGRIGDVVGRQVLKSGTSIGANYREALRASSRKQFVSILEIAEREADETLYWLELIHAAQIMTADRLADLQQECRELLAILTATLRSTKRRQLPTSEIRNPKSEI
ncbi:four helix bundle protein [Phycisphaerales bacterium AB-hyl4]|uniref:Four helix bundle protein n=1 Tax=Natronomicrosphaera hydrolytica TaxID=3242702 RepID=A0ABV4TZL6_9BACT